MDEGNPPLRKKMANSAEVIQLFAENRVEFSDGEDDQKDEFVISLGGDVYASMDLKDALDSSVLRQMERRFSTGLFRLRWGLDKQTVNLYFPTLGEVVTLFYKGREDTPKEKK